MSSNFLSKWVYQYLKYPKSAVKEGISGTVVVEFVIDKSGNIRDVNVVKSVSPSLDDEAVKVVSSSPKWKPAEYNGEKVNVKTSVPIVFKLTDKGGIYLKKW
jgi:TonB family C-terminal domain